MTAEPSDGDVLDSTDARMRTLVEGLARALVDEPDAVSVKEIKGASTTVYEVTVAKSDVGKLIGKQGRTLLALRTVVAAVSTKFERKSVLEIID
jgi:predicted RNA-binding protein YlqC (UPF0109 family)